MSNKNYSFLIRGILVLCALLLVPAVAAAWTGKVVHVADGDTINVLRNGQEVRVRLYGIDTPESDQPFGSRAGRFTANMVSGRTVEVDPIDKDQYGRTIGMVFLSGDIEKCLNERLVEEGFAWVYSRYCKDDFCEYWKNLERQARSADRGLWQRSNPVPPWDWRRK